MKTNFTTALFGEREQKPARDLKRRDRGSLNRGTHRVVTALEWVLMAASAAFSYSFFEGLMGMIAIPKEASMVLAALLTIVQSVAISRAYHSIIYEVLEAIDAHKKNGTPIVPAIGGKTYMVAVLCAAMIAFDIVANFAGIPMLANTMIKKPATFAETSYAGASDLQALQAQADAIIRRNSYKGNTYVQRQDKQLLAEINRAIAAHTSAKTEILTASKSQFTQEEAARTKRVEIAIAFLGWFNIGAYLIMLLIVPVQHLTERENDAKPATRQPQPAQRFVDVTGGIAAGAVLNPHPQNSAQIGFRHGVGAGQIVEIMAQKPVETRFNTETRPALEALYKDTASRLRTYEVRHKRGELKAVGIATMERLQREVAELEKHLK